jgi:WD40 repeat protein
MTRPHAESHRRIKLIAIEFDRLVTRLRSLPEGDRTRTLAEISQTAQAARRQPELLDWAVFLDTHAHLMARGGALALLQSAVGLASTSLVTLAAEEWALGRSWKVPWFRRTQRPRDFKPGALVRLIEADPRRPLAVAVTPDGARAIFPSATRASAGVLELWCLESGQLLASSAPRKGRVESLALLPDGSGAIVGGEEGAVERWTLEPLALTKRLGAHEGPAARLAVSPDGTRAASAGVDGVLVFDVASGRLLARVPPRPGGPHRLAFSVDGERLALGALDGTLSLFSATSGELLASGAAHDGGLEALLAHPDGLRLVTGGRDGTVKAWDASSLALLAPVATHRAPVRALTVDETGAIVSGDEAGEIRITEPPAPADEPPPSPLAPDDPAGDPAGEAANEGAADATLPTPSPTEARASRGFSAGESVGALRVLPRGDIACGGGEGGLRLLDKAGALLGHVVASDGRVSAVASLGASGHLASIGDDGTLRVLDVRGASAPPPLASRAVEAVDSEGQRALCLSHANELELGDRTEGRRLRRVFVLGDRARLVGANLDRGVAVIETFRDRLGILESLPRLPAARTLHVLDIERGELLRPLEPHERSTRALAFHPDGKRVIAAGGDRRVRVFDLDRGTCLFSLEGHGSTISALALHPDGKRAASIDWEGQLCVWNIDRGKRLARHELNAEGPFWSLVLPEDTSTVTLGSASGLIATFDLDSGRKLRSSAEHTAEVHALALSEDGALLASASDDRTLRLFGARSLKPLCRWDSPSPVVGCRFLPDGRIALWHPRGEVYYLKFNDWGLGEDA